MTRYSTDEKIQAIMRYKRDRELKNHCKINRDSQFCLFKLD